jgi:hypothetical protein
MTTYVERLNGTVRREALDHFLMISRKQIKNIVSKFVEYYNTQRMHQGINKIPDAEIHENSGVIKKLQILSGLHHQYSQTE